MGFNVDYVRTISSTVDIDDDEEVEAIDTEEVLMDDQRISNIVDYVLKIHNSKTNNRRYNAIFTVRSIPMLIKYYDEKSKLYLNSIMDNIVPTRDEFISVYKYCITNKHIEITLNKIKAVFGVMPLKIFVILSVFREFNLLEYTINEIDNILIIDFTKQSISKFNLDESLILINIKELKDRYLESY